jgi:basic membrane protein A
MQDSENKFSRRTFGKVAVGAGTAVAGVPLIGAARAQDKKFKVAFIYVGPIGDMGWSWAQDQGRK